MRITALLLLGLGGLATPLAAQTVGLPSARQTEGALAREKALKEAAAQARMVDKMNAINDTGTNGFDIVSFDNRVRLVRGTPFVFPSWAMGDVLLGTAIKPTPGVLKFDAYNQQVRALRPQGDSIILATEQVQAFTLRPTGKNGKPTERHFERLASGLIPDLPVAYAENVSAGNELRLLKFHQKTILKGHADSSYGNNNPVDSFKGLVQYYLRWADGTYVLVKPTKASILAAVALRQPTVVASEMQDKTKARTDEELSAVVQRINNSLTSK